MAPIYVVFPIFELRFLCAEGGVENGDQRHHHHHGSWFFLDCHGIHRISSEIVGVARASFLSI